MTVMSDQTLIRPSIDADIETMLAIYRHHVRRGLDPSYLGEDGVLLPDDLKRRRRNMRRHRLPHLVAERGGVVVGYAYAVLFRKRPAYRYTVKHSIYVHPDHLHSGVGKVLLPALIDACAAAGYRQIIAYVDSANAPSLRLHEQCGFRQVGYLPSVGYKFGHWTDVVMVQRSLGAGGTAPPDAWLAPARDDD
ncbi:GNAT family N-acetyltransferase [Rhodoplanes roseus]|uniref:GNAT family N-acetyltransferase n=1 Tax=Rhodoplanes roseus TaxID=29409 RepID=A0A327L8H2_9BRAD|nr:GNAT family N-acetyltransferase [Rhodoplanes roseus]RAI45802.1 GNAT family N-acetyltransferase [Rhodoplanes roseus]